MAVAGLGFVGRETVRLLRANASAFRRRLGADLVMTAVADRDAAHEARKLGLPRSVLRLGEPAALLKTDCDVVVELLGGLDAPRALVNAALRSGRHVVTANKRLLSHCWDELRKSSSEGGGRLYFEGSVAGGIPLLHALDQSFSANRIEGLHGILNGTTNYILSRAEEGLSMPEALAEAQRLGFAEKDPSLDMSGGDTAQKISVLASLITGHWLRPARIATSGIERVEALDVEFCRKTLGKAVRLLGTLRLEDGVVEAHVAPTLVPLEHPLAAVRREYNAVLVRTSSAGDLMFYGKGAGPGPTASAVVGDLFMLSRDVLGGAPSSAPPPAELRERAGAEAEGAYYVRLLAQDKPGVLARLTASLAKRGISIATIHQSDRGGRAVPIMLTTHATTDGSLRAALRGVPGLRSVMRIL